jgi:RNase P subunit RPR2
LGGDFVKQSKKRYFPSRSESGIVAIKELLSPEYRYLLQKEMKTKICIECLSNPGVEFYLKTDEAGLPVISAVCAPCYEKLLLPDAQTTFSHHPEDCSSHQKVLIPDHIHKHLEKAYLYDGYRNKLLQLQSYSGLTSCIATFSPELPEQIKREIIVWTTIPIPDHPIYAKKTIITELERVGWSCQNELRIADRGDGRPGRIDFLASKENVKIAVELDNYKPRNKSLYKLKQVSDAFRLIILRGAVIDIDNINCDIDAVISLPISTIQRKNSDIRQLLIECLHEIPW